MIILFESRDIPVKTCCVDRCKPQTRGNSDFILKIGTVIPSANQLKRLSSQYHHEILD